MWLPRRKVEEAQLAAARAAEAAAVAGSSGGAALGSGASGRAGDIGGQQPNANHGGLQLMPPRRPTSGLIVVEEGALG